VVSTYSDIGARAPAAVDLHGKPLFDAPPSLPSSDFYATADGFVWYRLPDEDEAQFCKRVRTSAATSGLERVTMWRRRDVSCTNTTNPEPKE
jgi:hypothetical protein